MTFEFFLVEMVDILLIHKFAVIWPLWFEVDGQNLGCFQWPWALMNFIGPKEIFIYF